MTDITEFFSVRTASDIADVWDKHDAEAKKYYDSYVDENPDQWWIIAIAASAQDIGAGSVDVLRLGKGAAEGGWGYLEDALRLVGMAPVVPAATAGVNQGAKAVHSAKKALMRRLGRKNLKILKNQNANNCSWAADVHALQRTGAKPYATLEDLAKAHGTHHTAFAEASIDAGVNALRRLGAKVKYLDLRSLDDVKKAVRSSKHGIIKFAIKLPGEEVGHAVYAFKDSGRVRFSCGHTNKVFDSIQDFWKAKGQTWQVSGRKMLKIENGAVLKLPNGKWKPALRLHLVKVVGSSPHKTKTQKEPRPKKVAANTTKKLPRVKAPVKHLTGVQARLNNLGYNAGPVDGKNGPRTRRAVASFQEDNPPLRVDQIPGPNTQARLYKVYGS